MSVAELNPSLHAIVTVIEQKTLTRLMILILIHTPVSVIELKTLNRR